MAPHKALWLLDSGWPSGMNPGTLSRNSTLCAFKRNPSVRRVGAVCPPRTGNTRTGNTVPIVGGVTGSWRKPTNRKLLSIEKITEIQKKSMLPSPATQSVVLAPEGPPPVTPGSLLEMQTLRSHQIYWIRVCILTRVGWLCLQSSLRGTSAED